MAACSLLYPLREWNRVTNPRVHDNVNKRVPGLLGTALNKYGIPAEIAGPFGTEFHPYFPGRIFRYLDSGSDTDVAQQAWQGTGNNLTFQKSLSFLNENIYQDRNFNDPFGAGDGRFDTKLAKDASGNYIYQQWLKHNYGLDIPISDEDYVPN